MPDKNSYRYLLAFGSNLGAVEKNCHDGLQALSQFVKINKCSKWIETEPLPSTIYDIGDHGSYLNFVVDIATSREPKKLYNCIVEIEDAIGHCRERRWAPRRMDIDILFWADNVHSDFSLCTPKLFKEQDDDLEVPHREVWARDFLIDLIVKDFTIAYSRLRSHCRGTLLS